MDKKYTYKVTSRTPRPRSKRLQVQGIGSTSSTVVLNTQTGGGSTTGDGHSHANKDALDQITTNSEGYLLLDLLKEITTTDPTTGEVTINYETVREKVKAGYADLAYDLDEDSPVNDRFLSKVSDDVAAGRITFTEGLIAVGLSVFRGGAQFGTFVKSLYAGSGAGIDPNGNAEFESVRVRTYFEAVELIINRLSALEGDQLFTEADTIDSVDDLGDGTYGVHLHPKYDGYFTAQAVGNVIKGIVNNLGASALGLNTGAGNAQMYTSWFRVNSVDAAENFIEVSLYPDNQTPAGQNFPPCALMKIARWGNDRDTTRQTCFYLSSTEGRIVKLRGVTKPIIDAANYGATMGELPDFVRTITDDDGNPLPIREGLDYMYIPGIVTMDIIRLNKWTMLPIATIVDRGEWVQGGLYYFNAVNPSTGEYEVSDVWYQGCRYRCCTNLTTSIPSITNTDWAFIEGNPEFTAEFTEMGDVLLDPDRIDLTLVVVAKYHNQIVTDQILAADVTWTRYSEDAAGVERVDSDAAWNIRRGASGKSLTLTAADMDFNGYVPRKVKITATVVLRDDDDNEIAGARAVFEY